MQTIGYLRFSFFGRNDTRLSKGIGVDQDKYFDDLYDADRMESRFHFFENLLLPSLSAQTDQNFQIVIIGSDVMPEPYRRRLSALVEDDPKYLVHFSRKRHLNRALRPVTEDLLGSSAGRWIAFRIDDDDPLGTTYIADIKKLAQGTEGRTILSLPRGAHLLSFGGRTVLAPRSFNFQGAGWAMCQDRDEVKDPYKFGHTTAATRFPSRINDVPFSHVYTIHENADSAAKKSGRLAKMAERAIENMEPERFEAARSEIEAAFPTIGYDGLINAFSNRPTAGKKL